MVIRIIVAVKSNIQRGDICGSLKEITDFQVVAETGNVHDALRLTQEKGADVVIADIDIPVKNGLIVASRITRSFPEVKIIILSLYSDISYIHSAFQAGIHGYVLINNAVSEIVAAMRTVLRGEKYISPELKRS